MVPTTDHRLTGEALRAALTSRAARAACPCGSPSRCTGETVGRLAFLHPDITEKTVREILASLVGADYSPA
ncbi:hypothetical protein [Streptomyces sp. ISL-99]|uniref:hypothetical protein n=1 Tax=Streptomyces sp. ISL-99 TaxID=2819193 RepID=UPI002034EE60|nr:hypothetical protein [Streptomyces sp. ISL-99]